MANQMAGATTASLTPWIAKEFGWNAGFLAAAEMCVVGSLAWLLVDPERQVVSPAVRECQVISR